MVELDDIQGIVAHGYQHLDHARFLFLRVLDRRRAAAWLQAIVPSIQHARPRHPSEPKPSAHANVAFTASGLRALGLTAVAMTSFPREFVVGMAHPDRARVLGDTGESAPEYWEVGGPQNREVHVLLLLYAVDAPALDALTTSLWSPADHGGGLDEVFRQESVRHGPQEPFGFRDGISQPAIEGVSKKVVPGQSVVKAGEFVLGYDDEYGVQSPVPTLTWHGTDARTAFGRNGTFLVWRKLAQDVDGFWRFMESRTQNPDGSKNAERATWLAAKCFGRWPSGAPLVLSPDRDDPGLGADGRRNNDFTFAATDPDGLACPIGSHVRRANPRDTLHGDPSRSLCVVNRHRIIRRGRPYEESAGNGGSRRGLVFIAINVDLQRQFEFIQQTWINSPTFVGLYADKDPIAGDNDGGGVFSIQQRPARRRIAGLPRFVTVRGGAYFFLPGLRALGALAAGTIADAGRRRATPASADDRWSDALLDPMRAVGDPLADEAVAAVFASGQVEAVHHLMNTLVENDQPPPEDLPAAVKDYLDWTTVPPPDLPRVRRGERLFADHGPEIIAILACYSLPQDYAAWKGVRVLYETGYLLRRPNRRVFETAQMIIDVMKPGGLEPHGDGIRAAQKVRLMHAAVRHLILHNKARPWDSDLLGVPINQEDLAGTLMSFAYIVVDGLRRLGVAVAPEAAEDYLDAWRVVGRIMGIQERLLPTDMRDAQALTETIVRRQVDESAEGRLMAHALLEMLESNAPPLFKGFPAALMRHFLSAETADQLGVPRHRLDERIIDVATRLAGELDDVVEHSKRRERIIRRFSLHLLQWMVDVDRGGKRSQFHIPSDLQKRWAPPSGGREATFWGNLVHWFASKA
jgi:Dyp-type peroxidase family